MTFDALGFDPAPGSPPEGEAMARRLRRATSALEEMDQVLSGSGAQQWQGHTATVFHGLVDEELQPRVRDAFQSFDNASRALERWLVDLEDHQRRALALEAEAQSARAAVAGASSAVDGLTAPTTDEPGAQQAHDRERAQRAAQMRSSRAALDDVLRRARALADEATTSAATTAGALDTAMRSAPDEPGLWDKLGDALEGIGDFLADVVEFVRENWWDLLHQLVNIAATVLAVASLFFPALAPFALGLAVLDVAMSGRDWARGVPGAKEAFLTGALGLAGGALFGKAASAFMDAAGPALARGPFTALATAGGGTVAAPAAAVLSYNPAFGPALSGYMVIKAKDSKDASDAVTSLLGGDTYYSGHLARGWREARDD